LRGTAGNRHEQLERREVLVGPDDEAVVDRELGLVGVALRRERDTELLEEQRVEAS
jgi:hypothetical protein